MGRSYESEYFVKWLLLNILCYLIVSRKDQFNKKKLSLINNCKNAKKGAVKGAFDRKNLFQQAEQGFDKLFNYKRELTESFEYYTYYEER